MRLTRPAQLKIAELLSTADDGIDSVRIFVTGGGCSGMTYGMTYAEETTVYDSVLEGNGFTVLVDTVALNYLRGCEIDFEQGSFQFRNVFQAVGGSGACGGCSGGAF